MEAVEKHRVGLLIAGAATLAILFGVMLPLLGYRFDQAPHRLFKVVGAGVVLTLFILRPTWLPALVCFFLPFSNWLPKSPIPFVNAINLLMIGAFLGVAHRSLQGKVRSLVAASLNIPILLFLVWMVFSGFYGAFLWPDRIGSGIGLFQRLWAIIWGFLIFFVVTHLVDDRKHVWQTVGFLLLGSTLGLLGPLREALHAGLGTRTGGGAGDINRMGAFLAMAGVFALAIIPVYRGMRKIGVAVAGVLTAVGMILPNSRGAYVGFLTAILPQAVRTNLMVTILTVALVGGATIWAPSFVKERVERTWQAASSEDRGEALDADSGGRLTIWKQIIVVIGEHPVTGVGLGNLREATRLSAGNYKHAHNLYLEVAGEMGLVGLALLIWLFVKAWRMGSMLTPRGGRTATLGRAYHGVILCLLVTNIFGQRFLDVSLNGFFFLLSGLVATEERLTRVSATAADVA